MNRSPAAQRRTIVIAGGGPVGLSIATLLSSSSHTEDLDIRLFEPRQVPSWEVDTVDLRVYALSRASQNVLENLGVWKTVAAARAAPSAWAVRICVCAVLCAACRREEKGLEERRAGEQERRRAGEQGRARVT